MRKSKATEALRVASEIAAIEVTARLGEHPLFV